MPKQDQQLARQLFSLSVVGGTLSTEHVGAVLQYLEKHPPARPLAASQLDSMLQLILRRLIGKVNASKYSWHSARIYLACSLLAAGASHAQIQALCRWQTEDSLRVYARLNPSSYRELLSRAASAQVDSVSVGSLPPLSSELAIRQLLGLSLVDAHAASA
jgi:hypothetical protein